MEAQTIESVSTKTDKYYVTEHTVELSCSHNTTKMVPSHRKIEQTSTRTLDPLPIEQRFRSLRSLSKLRGLDFPPLYSFKIKSFCNFLVIKQVLHNEQIGF
jgi:hypothetical protein